MTALLVSLLALFGYLDDAAPTAAVDQPHGVVAFEIRDCGGDLIPGRLTFVPPDGTHPALFPNHDAMPSDLALRRNAVYTLSGRGRFTVPAGTYDVFVSRGLEWSIHRQAVTIKPDAETPIVATLIHEVDTKGWISGDFHLHTLTNSGHGDSNMEERIISCIGEGLEFAVATDHNFHTDYGPTIDALDAAAHMGHVSGNEVTTSIGHFNTFPVTPGGPAIEHRFPEGGALFKVIREHENPLGIVPVIQINHPRWSGMDYFGFAELDPVTGFSNSPIYSRDYDAIELLNENTGWGYYDSHTSDRDTAGQEHWLLQDWFNLLNRGHYVTALGNSDSHHVLDIYAAYPRNYIRSSTDDPARIDVREIAERVRSGEAFLTTGPFVRFSVDGFGPGQAIPTRRRRVSVRVRIEAASWIDVDRYFVIFNGDVVEERPVLDTREPLRVDDVFPLSLDQDGWMIIIVEGDDTLEPIVHNARRPVRPLAITNPVRLDIDGDRRITPPLNAAHQLVTNFSSNVEYVIARFDIAPPSIRCMLLQASIEERQIGIALARRGLADPDRRVRLTAARSVERLAAASAIGDLQRVIDDPATDDYLGLAAFRALMACTEDDHAAAMVSFIDRFGTSALASHGDEVRDLLPGRAVTRWRVAGYFPSDCPADLARPYGPEVDSDAEAFAGKDDASIVWRPGTARDDGLLSLLQLDPDPQRASKAIAYAETWLHVDDARRVLFASGSDDGCRIFLNDEMIYEDLTQHGATPMQHVGQLDLHAGWNRLLVKVQNVGGNFGLIFQVFDDAVRLADRPDDD